MTAWPPWLPHGRCGTSPSSCQWRASKAHLRIPCMNPRHWMDWASVDSGGECRSRPGRNSSTRRTVVSLTALLCGRIAPRLVWFSRTHPEVSLPELHNSSARSEILGTARGTLTTFNSFTPSGSDRTIQTRGLDARSLLVACLVSPQCLVSRQIGTVTVAPWTLSGHPTYTRWAGPCVRSVPSWAFPETALGLRTTDPAQ